MPQAGTVGFLQYDAPIDSESFAKEILEQEGVFYVPGSCFDCEKHLRLGLTADPSVFAKGLQLTAAFIKKQEETK
jgi:aspartate/methionine/tyrosine aminotransferase